MARPLHQAEPFHRRQVEAMAGYGVPEADIADMIGVDPKTLRKHYRQELDQGHTKANIKVAENLFRKATGEGRESVIAAIFWLKARAGWKETSQTEISGSGGRPLESVTRIERIILTPGVIPPRHEDIGPHTDSSGFPPVARAGRHDRGS